MEENREENIKNTPNVQAGDEQTPHKRRVRYKGKYPKKFEEKYKELQPEKYKETAEHIIQKGNTPETAGIIFSALPFLQYFHTCVINHVQAAGHLFLHFLLQAAAAPILTVHQSVLA